MPNHVLQLDCATGSGDVEVDLGSLIPDLWIEFDIAFNATYISTIPSQQAIWLGHAINGFVTISGGVLKWRCGAAAAFTPAIPLTSMQFYRVKLHLAGAPSGPALSEMWVDGVLIGTDTAAVYTGTRFFDLSVGGSMPGALQYYDNFQAGTTEGGIDLGTDDFEGGSLAYWTGGTFAASIVTDPGIAPSGPAPPPDISDLVVRLYDLGTNELADISDIAFEITWSPRLNLIDQAVVTAPAGHTLLTTVAGDGYPNLHRGNRKLVIWENADPATDDPIFHGRVIIVERNGDGTENLVTITAANPIWELGYASEDRAGRVVRGSTTAPTAGDPFGNYDGNFINPKFASSVVGQDEISGPDLILQALTNSQNVGLEADPTPGEGPLPIDLQSGTFDLAVPPAVDLSCDDKADWPEAIGDLITLLIQTNVVDIYLKPVRPGTGLNLDGDPDDYIMGALSAVSSFGEDKSATVHYDYWTGSKNAAQCRHVDDFSTILNKLDLFLGPRLNQSHWRGVVNQSAAGAIDGDASQAIYGGPGADKGAFFQIQVQDGLGTEAASKPLWLAYYNGELGLRREPRQMLFITPSPGSKALFMPPGAFHVGDLIAVNVGAELGLALADTQRVYGYDKQWDRQRVPSITNLITSADAE